MACFKSLTIVVLCCVTCSVILADETFELAEQQQILAILKKTEHAEYYDRAKLPELYQEARQKLAELKVSESNRSKLLQARTLHAVLGKHWDDFHLLAKEFDAKDSWFLKVKTWQLQMRVACEDWKSLADDVIWLVDDLVKKPLNLADSSQPTSQVSYQLLRLRQALIWLREKELPQELQTIVDQVDRLRDTYAKDNGRRPDRVYPGFAEDYEWLAKVDFLSGSYTREQLKAIVVDQEKIVASARSKTKEASEERADAQASLGRKKNLGRAEDKYYDASRRSGYESRTLALWKELERTADSQLSMPLRAGLWVWQSEQIRQTSSDKRTWTFQLENEIKRKP